MRSLLVPSPWSVVRRLSVFSGVVMVGLITNRTSPAQDTTPPAQDKTSSPAKGNPSDRGKDGQSAQMMSQMREMMGGRQAKPAKAAQSAEPTLEEMLNKALKDNPDIRVAEAKVREADAELNRTRLQVTQKVLIFHRSRESQKAIVKVEEDNLARVQKLNASAAVSAEDVKEAQQRLSASKAKLAEIEAEMPYLLGQQQRLAVSSVAFSPDGKRIYANGIDGAVKLWDATTGKLINDPTNLNITEWQSPFLTQELQPYVNWNTLHSVDLGLAKPAQEAGSIVDKVRKALETQVTVDYKQKAVHDILEDLKKKVPGLSIHDLSGISRVVITLQIDGQVPVRTALEMLEDTASVMLNTPGRVSFVLRDYGLLFAPNTSLPPDAVHISNLSRGGIKLTKPENEKTPAKDDKKPAAEEKKH